MSRTEVRDVIVLIGGRFDGYEVPDQSLPLLMFTMKVPTRDGGQIHYTYIHDRSEPVADGDNARHLFKYCEE